MPMKAPARSILALSLLTAADAYHGALPALSDTRWLAHRAAVCRAGALPREKPGGLTGRCRQLPRFLRHTCGRRKLM